MGLRERAVAEGSVDLRRRTCGNGLFIGRFRAGVRHRGLEGLDFWHFLGRTWDALAARDIPRIGVFAFTMEAIASGASGA